AVLARLRRRHLARPDVTRDDPRLAGGEHRTVGESTGRADHREPDQGGGRHQPAAPRRRLILVIVVRPRTRIGAAVRRPAGRVLVGIVVLGLLGRTIMGRLILMIGMLVRVIGVLLLPVIRLLALSRGIPIAGIVLFGVRIGVAVLVRVSRAVALACIVLRLAR